jgi:hypothetical protein
MSGWDMFKLSGKKGQSMFEFALILPVAMLLVSGIIQLSIIFMNMMFLKYEAYMVARVAAVYGEGETRADKAKKARDYLNCGLFYMNNYDPDMGKAAKNMAVSALIKYFSSFMSQGDGIKLSEETINSSKGGKFIKVVVTYDLPLTVPVANKIFGAFQGGFVRWLASQGGITYYTIKADAIMRIEKEKNGSQNAKEQG